MGLSDIFIIEALLRWEKDVCLTSAYKREFQNDKNVTSNKKLLMKDFSIEEFLVEEFYNGKGGPHLKKN